jgi:hypothetical protein
MNINELDSYNLSDAINFHSELNPQLFVGDEMRPPVRAKLLEIAQDFIEFIGISNLALVDITISGSNAAYSYTPYSDIDLHLVVDFNQLSQDEVYRELFDAKKYQYNDQHDIKIKGYDVEVYVQDVRQPHSSLGEYSVNRNDWNKIPTKRRANLDDIATKLKYEKLRQLSLQALAADDLVYLKNVLDVLKRYRRAGLAQGGEFSPENLAFKMLRKQGLFKKLWDKKYDHEDKILSLENTDIQEFNYLDNSKQISESIKSMYKHNSGLFDKYSFNAVYAAATKLVEDGRIVKGVNTTDDVGVDQIKIEAGKVGFTVDKDGRPPLLRESIDELFELNMSPGFLKGEVGKLVKTSMPIIGVELEVCWPRNKTDFESDTGGEITISTTWEDIESFFSHNDEADFRGLRNDYEEWLQDESAEWTSEKTESAKATPGQDVEQKLDFLVDYHDMDRSEAQVIIDKAQESFEKFGSALEWGDIVDDLSDESQTYHRLFVEENDTFNDAMLDFYLTDFYENELAWDDSQWTVAAWLKNHKGYENMQDLFFDYSDDLYWPGGSLTDEVYDADLAEKIASDLYNEAGLDIVATGDYHSGQSDDSGHRSEWNIEEDTSIIPEDGDAGFEIVSPALEYTDAMEQFSETVKYLVSNGAYTTPSCGLHINVSLQGVDHNSLDYPKLVLMVGDQYLLKKFGRELNTYAISAVQQMDNILSVAAGGGSGAKGFIEFIEQVRRKLDKTLMHNLGDRLDFGKYTSIGLKSNRIEFRMAGGAAYLQRWESDIVPMINRFIVAYAVAANPEAYKKDYAKKLYKLASSGLKSKGQRTEEALRLFALFASGSMTKQQLVKKIKELQAKNAPRTKKINLDPTKASELAQRLAMLHNTDESSIRAAIQKGVEYENIHGKFTTRNELHSLIARNLMNDPAHYEGVTQ